MNTTELRELDAWIAEHVFGETVKHLEDYYACAPAGNPVEPVNRYTTDPAAAMAVLEKCCSRTVSPIMAGVARHGYYCTNKLAQAGGFPKLDKREFHKTLPLSICLFAKNLFTP